MSSAVPRALLRANVRYWQAVAPRVTRGITLWEQRARSMPDPRLRLAALEKLRRESFNVQAAATLATLAPPARRTGVTDAGVALQIAYDYLDLVTEQPALAGEDGGRGLLLTLAAAMDPRLPPPPDGGSDAGYLRALLTAVQDTLRRLPSTRAVIEAAGRSVRRCAEGQARGHAAGTTGGELALRRWASTQPEADQLGWRELAAGASASVLCLHALVAAAADVATSTSDAARLQILYLSIGALTMLDGVADRDLDAAMGARTWSSRYRSEQEMAAGLACVARRARSLALSTPDGAHHLVTLAGVAAYYAAAAPAALPRRGPIMSALHQELGGALALTLPLMRLWRAAKSVRAWAHVKSPQTARAGLPRPGQAIRTRTRRVPANAFSGGKKARHVAACGPERPAASTSRRPPS